MRSELALSAFSFAGAGGMWVLAQIDAVPEGAAIGALVTGGPMGAAFLLMWQRNRELTRELLAVLERERQAREKDADKVSVAIEKLADATYDMTQMLAHVLEAVRRQ